MNDAIISPKVVETILSRLTDVESVHDYKRYIKTVESLFDNENALLDVAKDIANTLIEIVSRPDMDAATKHLEIVKGINRATLVGFLSERYVRDKVMDSASENDNTMFTREYEKLDDFISRRIGAKDDISAAVKSGSQSPAPQAW